MSNSCFPVLHIYQHFFNSCLDLNNIEILLLTWILSVVYLEVPKYYFSSNQTFFSESFPLLRDLTTYNSVGDGFSGMNFADLIEEKAN